MKKMEQKKHDLPCVKEHIMKAALKFTLNLVDTREFINFKRNRFAPNFAWTLRNNL